jgi:hypothetical protein
MRVPRILSLYIQLEEGDIHFESDHDEKALPAALAPWIPNSALAVIADPLLYRACRAEI